MNILNDKTDITSFSTVEMEQVQQDETEYTLLGTFLRRKGMNLYYYNPKDNEVKEATIKFSDTIHIYKLPDRWLTVDWEYQRCTVEGMFIYFESLNIYNAKKRVDKWKRREIKELANLKVPSKEGIKFF